MDKLTNSEKRALEIYITLISQHIRKNNSKALNDLRAFFYALAFTKKYDPELLYTRCIENIEIFEKIPTHYEIVLTLSIISNILQFRPATFRPYYRKPLTHRQKREAMFSEDKICMRPKINCTEFHYHLLTFLQEFAKIGRAIPIKKGGKRK